MEINREKYLIDMVDLSFRYIIVDQNLALSLVEKLKKFNFVFELNAPTKRNLNYVIAINMETFFDDDIISGINLELNISQNSFGFWFAINSEFETGGFTIPEKIVTSIKRIGGKIDFSFFSSK